MCLVVLRYIRPSSFCLLRLVAEISLKLVACSRRLEWNEHGMTVSLPSLLSFLCVSLQHDHIILKMSLEILKQR